MKMVHEILNKYLPDNIRVYVFGSRANWTTKDSSDLDLALEGESQIEYEIIDKLKFAFKDSDLPYKVDVIDIKNVNDTFRKIIDNDKIIIHD